MSVNQCKNKMPTDGQLRIFPFTEANDNFILCLFVHSVKGSIPRSFAIIHHWPYIGHQFALALLNWPGPNIPPSLPFSPSPLSRPPNPPRKPPPRPVSKKKPHYCVRFMLRFNRMDKNSKNLFLKKLFFEWNEMTYLVGNLDLHRHCQRNYHFWHFCRCRYPKAENNLCYLITSHHSCKYSTWKCVNIRFDALIYLHIAPIQRPYLEKSFYAF